MSGIVNRVGAKSGVVNTFTSQGIDDNSTGTTGLTIDSSGYVKNATVPRSRSYVDPSYSPGTAQVKIPFSNERITSPDYNTSDKRFTTPVAGLYLVAWGGTTGCTGAEQYATTFIKVNGSATSTTRHRTSGASGEYGGGSSVTLLNLNSGDYIEIWGYTQASNAFFSADEFEFTVVFIG